MRSARWATCCCSNLPVERLHSTRGRSKRNHRGGPVEVAYRVNPAGRVPEPAGMAAGGDQDLDELIAELRNAPPERRKLLRDLLASWRQTG